MIDYKTFYAYARKAPFGGSLSTQQVNTMDAVLNYWFKNHGTKPLELLAYILATIFHETATSMLPIKETVMPYHKDKNPSDNEVIRRLDTAFAKGQLKGVSKPYWRKDKNGKAWFGRGLVQITHEDNYILFGLQKDPSQALDLATSIRGTVEGMLKASFGGKPLIQYYNPTTQSFNATGARATVNGSDKAQLIAGYYKNFIDALKAAATAYTTGRMPSDVVKTDATPDDIAPSSSGSALTLAAGPTVVGLAAPFVTGVDNLYSMIVVLALMGLSAFALWLILTGRITFNRLKSA